MPLVRVMLFGLGLHFKMLSRSPFDIFVVVASPLIFATLAYFLFQNGHGQSLLVAALASGVMGIWSTTTAQGAGALQTQRRMGILELLVAAPTPFWAVVLPITVAISAIGVYSLAIGLVYVRVLFGVAITIQTGSRSPWPCPPRSVRSGASASFSRRRSCGTGPRSCSATSSSGRCG